MKAIKVFYMGKPLNQVYPHATKWQVMKWKTKEFLKKILRFLFKVGLIGGVGYGLFTAGAYFNPVISYAVQEVKVPTDSEAPVLNRIASCESKGNIHFVGSQMGKNGQVLVHPNTNGTVDIGKYQINLTVWGAKATELGYNLFTEEGNYAMAKWIYLNKGTGDWSASQKCWQ